MWQVWGPNFWQDIIVILRRLGYATRKWNSIWYIGLCLSFLITLSDLLHSTERLVFSPFYRWVYWGTECTLSAGLSKKGEIEILHLWHVHYKIMPSDIYWESWRTQYMGPQGTPWVWYFLSDLSTKFINLFEPNFLKCTMVEIRR